MGTKFPQNSCCMRLKLPPHIERHVAATCPWHTTISSVCTSCDFVLLHIPITCPCLCGPLCVQHAILSLLHVAATCPPRVMAP